MFDLVGDHSGGRGWWAVVSVTLGGQPDAVVLGHSRAGAQASDADALPSGAQALGDVTSWDASRHFDGELDGVDDMVDYFAFSLSEAKRVTVALRLLDFDADVFVEDAGGAVLASSASSGNANERIAEPMAAGDYYVRVQAKEAGANSYRLRVRVIEAPEGSVFSGELRSGHTGPGRRGCFRWRQGELDAQRRRQCRGR